VGRCEAAEVEAEDEAEAEADWGGAKQKTRGMREEVRGEWDGWDGSAEKTEDETQWGGARALLVNFRDGRAAGLLSPALSSPNVGLARGGEGEEPGMPGQISPKHPEFQPKFRCRWRAGSGGGDPIIFPRRRRRQETLIAPLVGDDEAQHYPRCI
jgi:hypothetical protein